MAKTTQVILTDDIDGSKAAQTVTFAFDGHSYEIDLSKKNVTAFQRVLDPYLSAGRKVRGSGARRRGATSGKRDLAAIRAWAAESGFDVSPRGRISSAVLEAFDAAH